MNLGAGSMSSGIRDDLARSIVTRPWFGRVCVSTRDAAVRQATLKIVHQLEISSPWSTDAMPADPAR